MASNVFTKNEILQNLASKGYFIDAYTLDTFFDKWKVEAIFEDEQGSEFYDKNALDIVLNNLFNAQGDEKEDTQDEEVVTLSPTVAPQENVNQEFIQAQQIDNQQYNQQYSQQQYIEQPHTIYNQQQNQYPPQQQFNQQNNIIGDPETNNILNNIALSDGTPLIQTVQNVANNNYIDYTEAPTEQPTTPVIDENESSLIFKKEKKMGILEGAMLATGQEFEPEPTTSVENESSEQPKEDEEGADFDDISLLSESYEAQEKFREYVVSELAKKNVDVTPKNNEFKLDISERTLNMIARSMAKKIARHVSQLCSADSKSSEQLTQAKEENRKLELRTKDLEDQNRKLKLLLAESNKNLNSYKPSIFGLYKKVSPKQ